MTAAVLLLALAMVTAGGPAFAKRRVAKPEKQSRTGDELDCGTDLLAAASTFDVFAVCLAAGMSVPSAAAAVASSAPMHLRAVLRRAADLLTLGGDADTAWSTDAAMGDSADGLMRLARRSASSGTALAHGLADLAEQSRQDATQSAAAAAGRATVLIAGPLGLCFLPAFVCLGIVPVVLGLAGDVFSVDPL